MFGYLVIKKKTLDKMSDEIREALEENRRIKKELAQANLDIKRFKDQWDKRESEHKEEMQIISSKYADELQKRVELADHVKRLEASQNG